MRLPISVGAVLLLLLQRFSTAQQRPFVSIEAFAPSTKTYRTSVCDRQRDLYEGKTLLQDALQGLNISVAMTNYKVPNEDAFFTLVDGKIKEENPGLFVVIMDEIALRAGFSWRNTFAAIDPLDSTIQVGKSWTDLLEWEVDSFDIAADYWARSVDRMARGISFPVGWYDGSIILVYSEDSTDKFNLWSFLLPFETNVWLAMAAAIFFSGLVYFFLERLNSSSDKRHLGEKPVTAIFLAAITFTGHFEYRPNTNAARLLSFSWTFWTLIMASAYTANMASFLVQRRAEVTSVSTIDDAVRQAVPVCVQRGAVIDEMLSKTNPDLILVRKDTEKEVFDGLKQSWYGGSGGCGLVLTNLGTFELYQSQKSSNADCSLTSEKRVILNMPAGFATAVDSGIMCTSLISYVMDYHLQQMKSDGFIDQAWQDHIARISTISCDTSASSQAGNVSLTLKDMGGIFIAHALMTIMALSLAILQYLYAKFRMPGSIRQSDAAASSRRSNLTSSLSTLWAGGSNPRRKGRGIGDTEDTAKTEDLSPPNELVQSDADSSEVVTDGDVHQ
ncbi:ionotropic glutamate receptor [Fragilaria crotonensis]|nr:ionotropic glutamate receptor [Fragilaria crotonensis]